ncbi:MAG: response regulator [Candidatus Binataceae bacterium]
MPFNETVMVVEDEDQAREFLIEILNYEGFDALGFPNGAEALTYLESATAPPCVVVLDLLMPVMNGRQLRAAMLEKKELAQIPVIVVTALDPSAARDLKPAHVLPKPVDVDQLLKMVRAHC